jgi:sn-glycerol 3-phosphate transport system substrate-binding protein
MAPRSPRFPRSVVALLAGLAFVAAACSDPPTAGGRSAAPSDEGGSELPDCPLDALDEADGPVDITLWFGGIGSGGPARNTLDAVVQGFNDSQDEVHLEASDQGGSNAEVYRKFESAASANRNQLPDVVYLENTQLRVLHDSGLVLPAQSCMEADDYDVTNIKPSVRAAFSVNDALYPGYMNATSQVLYYNKAHFARAGLDPNTPPKTLDELYEGAKALKASGIPKPLAFKVSHTVLENWLGGAGVDMVNENNGRDGVASEATFDTPEAKDILALLKKMNDEGLLNVFAPTEGGTDHYIALATQQSSMLIETSTATSAIAQFLGGNLTPEDVGSDVDTSTLELQNLVPGTGFLPGVTEAGQSAPGGTGFFIVAGDDPAKEAASWMFLKYMLQPENAQAWHTGAGYLPILKAVDDEPAVQAFWQDDLAGVLVKPAVDQLDDADPDEPSPLIGPFPDYNDDIEGAMESVLLENKGIDSALADASDEVTASLERYAG